MNKRTELLLVSLVLSGAAIAAAMTSNDGVDPTEEISDTAIVAEAPATPAEAATTVAEPEHRGNPVVYDMDIPAEVLSDY